MSDDRTIEDVLRRYALGVLSGAQLEEAEARLLTDDDFAEGLEAIEAELADEYVGGELDASEHAQFAERLRRSASLRERVAAAQTLAEVATRRRFTGPAAAASAAPRARHHTRSSWLLAAAAGAAIIIGGLWMTRVVSPRSEVPGGSTPAMPPTASGTTPLPVPAPPPSTTAGQSPAAVATIALFGAVVRDESAVPAFAVGGGSGMVRIEIHLDAADDHPSFDLSIETGSGQRVAAQQALPATRNASGLVVSMLMPAERLPPGRYAARVTGRRAAAATLIAVYPFRATR